MKGSTIPQLKKELSNRSPEELLAVCLRLAKFKKENRELLSYLLFESDDENAYIESVKREVTAQLEMINTKTYYWMRKSIRKILKDVKKYIRYSKKKKRRSNYCSIFAPKSATFRLPSVRIRP